ncbi:polysaccharide deacetylase family protein [Aequorivita marina]|uniref:polysaccharide deacetylase family protein n=1 Tax=Aequorivita marina TaxID=3073654 RepID=UPI002876B7FB|nr:polysaccharide deacetylase family protein [Aequorivita sp. S2608]MDS1298591.1 polysaccharide deacetylase family protein [Aequorivita sp. S2608]
MKLKLVKMPRFIQRLYPERIWAFSRKDNTVYLTFDDGPIPNVTPWVLEELKKHNAKATFFCIGNNIQKHPEVYKRVIAEGHSVGNHTFNHLNGWKTELSVYIENTEKAKKQLEIDKSWKLDAERSSSKLLFRPPYGRITSEQAKMLQKKGYKIVMWDIVSYDFDTTISAEKCLENVIKNIKPGSVVVFHDSVKAEKNLSYVLPKVLEHISEKGWKCASIHN